METRAVSARKERLAPLVVLVPILGMAGGAVLALAFWPPLIPIVIVSCLALTAIAGRWTYGVRIALATAGTTLVATFVSIYILLWALVGSSLCGKNVSGGWLSLALTGGALVYFAIGVYGFRTERSVAAVPMALIFGVVTLVVILRLVPGTAGYCD